MLLNQGDQTNNVFHRCTQKKYPSIHLSICHHPFKTVDHDAAYTQDDSASESLCIHVQKKKVNLTKCFALFSCNVSWNTEKKRAKYKTLWLYHRVVNLQSADLDQWFVSVKLVVSQFFPRPSASSFLSPTNSKLLITSIHESPLFSSNFRTPPLPYLCSARVRTVPVWTSPL